MNAGVHTNILNGLIDATMDSARHYRRVAGSIDNPRIRALFEHLSVQRKMVAEELLDQLAAAGGGSLREGMRLTHASHIFGNLRHAMNYGYCALIDEVERGEEHIKAKYEHALEDSGLSGLPRTAVLNAYESVREDGRRMHSLKCYPNTEHGHGEALQQW